MRFESKVVCAIATIVIFNGTLISQSRSRSSGLVLRGTFWDVDGEQSLVSVTNRWGTAEVNTGHAGGWICFFSQISNKSYMELSLGAMGRVGMNSHTSCGEEVEFTGILPILLGLRYHVIPLENPSALQPYVAIGGGPYWLSRVHVYDKWKCSESEVAIRSKLYPGFFAGGGVYFHLASWFALNVDMKYHFVDFDPSHEYSGLEFGIGFGFLWGKYRQ